MKTLPFNLIYLWILLSLGSYVPQVFLQSHQLYRNDSFRQGMFTSTQGYALLGRNMVTMFSADPLDCLLACLSNSECKSVNYLNESYIGGIKRTCEVIDETKGTRPPCFVRRPGSTYWGPENDVVVDHCVPNPCVNGGTCENTCEGPAYKCNCNQYNKGQRCEQWTVPVTSCKDIYSKTSLRQDMAHTFKVSSMSETVYCHMTGIPGCGSGGWTLTMKTDGRKNTFGYGSARWVNKEAYNPPAGETGFDDQETKLSTYWGVSFTKLCFGMKQGRNTLRWTPLSYVGASLHALIADGKYRSTSKSRNSWKSLLSKGSLQTHCNRRGFNVKTDKNDHARIGIAANQENNCFSCDSVIGFGINGGRHEGLTCGNRCRLFCDDGKKVVKTFGYILVQ